jgi:phage-related protein
VNKDEQWRVESYRDQRGRSPVQEFIDHLDAKMHARVLRSVDMLKEYGPRLPMPYARPVTGEHFWELRVQSGNNIVRIFYFAYSGREITLLHGFVKKDRKTPRAELEIARRRHTEILGRSS